LYKTNEKIELYFKEVLELDEDCFDNFFVSLIKILKLS